MGRRSSSRTPAGRALAFPGAGHAFFNDTRPEAYQKAAADVAWAKTLAHFARFLQS